MKLYPLVFSFRDLIAGNGFVAVVSMGGRVVLAEEDDQDFWMFGVQPGGIAGGDRQQAVALKEFKNSYLTVLFDIAAEASSFKEFQDRVTEFFNDINEPNAADWNAALADARPKNLPLADLETVKAASRPPKLTIEEVTPARINSGVNEFDTIAEAA